MRVRSNRLGLLEYAVEDILTFPHGMVGFPEYKQFILHEDADLEPFKWLVSLESADLSFFVVDPFLFFPDYEVGLETVRGLEEETVRRWTREWFFTRVVPHEAPGAHVVLRRHRDAGHPLVLLTSSSPYESRAALEFFGLDDFLSTRFQVVDGCFTGKLDRPVCAGAGKVTWAERYAAEHGIYFICPLIIGRVHNISRLRLKAGLDEHSLRNTEYALQ